MKRKMSKTFRQIEHSEKWGVPDWRDAAAYPRSLSDDLWRWEFLRRREDYRNDWELWYPRTAEWQKDHEDEHRFDALFLWMGNWHPDPNHPNFRALMPGSIEKYGLDGLPNPAIGNPENFYFTKPREAGFLMPGMMLHGGRSTAYMIPRDHGALCIDLKKPIRPQLARYEQLFARIAKGLSLKMNEDRKYHRGNFVDCLRALDAESEDVDIDRSTLHQTIRPTKRVKNKTDSGEELLRQAHELRDRISSP